jgi:hypothetical protein
MKYEKKHAGKWIAAKKDKVIASDTTLNKLMKKVEKTERKEEIKFALIPKGFIAG